MRALWLFILVGRISLYEETRYTLRISTIWKNYRQKHYRKLYQSSLRKTFVYLDRHFHVILHYFEPWILNEYFELLTTQSPVFIESQLNVLVLRIWRAFYWIEIISPSFRAKRCAAINILRTLFFSVRTVSYGTSFSPFDLWIRTRKKNRSVIYSTAFELG